jgi:hypothetical protein
MKMCYFVCGIGIIVLVLLDLKSTIMPLLEEVVINVRRITLFSLGGVYGAK